MPGYDVRDYYATAERYGTNEDLHRLFDRAHEFDMHVLLDLVPGHTAIDNPWFLESGKGTRNAWTDRYIWRPMTQSPNLNSPYESIRGFLGGIAERPDAAAVNCFSTQACLNYGFGTVTEDWQFAADSPEAQEGRLLIQNIMDFWLGLGADGFRVDMAGSLVKEDPDYYWTKQLWRQVRAHLDETHPRCRAGLGMGRSSQCAALRIRHGFPPTFRPLALPRPVSREPVFLRLRQR